MFKVNDAGKNHRRLRLEGYSVNFITPMALILLAAIPVAMLVLIGLGLSYELAREKYSRSTIAAVIISLILVVVTGFVFLSRFRFLR